MRNMLRGVPLVSSPTPVSIGVMRLFLYATLCGLLLCSVGRTSEPVKFADLGVGKPLKFADGKMTAAVEDGALRVSAPQMWSCGWQYERPVYDLGEADGTKRLFVTASGTAPAAAKLIVRLVSTDWKRADIYEIPLAGLSSGEAADVEATTVYGEPSEREGEGLMENEAPAHLQFLTKGEGLGGVDLSLVSFGLK